MIQKEIKYSLKNIVKKYVEGSRLGINPKIIFPNQQLNNLDKSHTFRMHDHTGRLASPTTHTIPVGTEPSVHCRIQGSWHGVHVRAEQEICLWLKGVQYKTS